jgi:hypothetical protein
MRKRTFVTIFVAMMLLMGMDYSNRAVAEVKVNVGIQSPTAATLHDSSATPSGRDTQDICICCPQHRSRHSFLPWVLLPSSPGALVQGPVL